MSTIAEHDHRTRRRPHNAVVLWWWVSMAASKKPPQHTYLQKTVLVTKGMLSADGTHAAIRREAKEGTVGAAEMACPSIE